MKNTRTTTLGAALLLILLTPVGLFSAEEQEQNTVTATEEIQVTATRIPEAVEPEPSAITVVSGQTLIDTGARDLSQALALVAGVSIAPGGDGGPASSVPEFWGLREFDAFLLVVDGIPWGGAFAPDLATLDLNDIERIEVLRGAAPVMYGATSFVGVIHVIHKSADQKGTSVDASIGNYSTGNVAARVSIPTSGAWSQAISGNYDAQGYKDDRTSYDRGHILYRALHKSESGMLHFDVDLNFLRQDPASPRPREGATLSDLVPVDTNNNPSDAKQDEDRYHFAGGYDGKIGNTDWALLGAFTHSTRHTIKGFLSELSNDVDPNAAGYRQTLDQNDLYLDGHFVMKPKDSLRFVFGADNLFGKGDAKSENFDYHVNLDGTNPQSSFDVPVQERPQFEDERNFFGLYGQMEWNATTKLLIQGGLRYNYTHENKDGEVLPGDTGNGQEEEGGKVTQTNSRLSGSIGASYLLWTSERDGLWAFGNYKNTFKPAVVDFGPEAEVDLLDPETAISYEAGLKGRLYQRRFDWQASFFLMDFTNLVTSTVVDGLPVLINAGEERFKGFEFEGEGEILQDLRWNFNYAHHSAKFTDFVQSFDGVPTQLAGKRLEMSPEDLVSGGIMYYPAKGFTGNFLVSYVGSRYLNKRNTALADAYTTLALGAGYRFGKNDIRFDIQNLTDERPAVSESELGDAQYYILQARSFRVTWRTDF